MDAIARATLKEPTKPERIRTKTSRRCHLRVYTIKLGSDERRATPNLRRTPGSVPTQSIGRCRRLVEDGGAGRLPLGYPLRQQRVELAFPIGEGVQLLPVAAVISGKLRADPVSYTHLTLPTSDLV